MAGGADMQYANIVVTNKMEIAVLRPSRLAAMFLTKTLPRLMAK
jgi:hypothetical protein